MGQTRVRQSFTLVRRYTSKRHSVFLNYHIQHYEKYRNFTWFPGMEILRNGIVSAQFRANRLKLCGNCAFLEKSPPLEIRWNYRIFRRVKLSHCPATIVGVDLGPSQTSMMKFFAKENPSSQSVFTCSKLTGEALEQGVKYVQS